MSSSSSSSNNNVDDGDEQQQQKNVRKSIVSTATTIDSFEIMDHHHPVHQHSKSNENSFLPSLFPNYKCHLSSSSSPASDVHSDNYHHQMKKKKQLPFFLMNKNNLKNNNNNNDNVIMMMMTNNNKNNPLNIVDVNVNLDDDKGHKYFIDKNRKRIFSQPNYLPSSLSSFDDNYDGWLSRWKWWWPQRSLPNDNVIIDQTSLPSSLKSSASINCAHHHSFPYPHSNSNHHYHQKDSTNHHHHHQQQNIIFKAIILVIFIATSLSTTTIAQRTGGKFFHFPKETFQKFSLPETFFTQKNIKMERKNDNDFFTNL